MTSIWKVNLLIRNSHTHIHTAVAQPSLACRREEPGIEPPTFWLVDDPSDLLSRSRPFDSGNTNSCNGTQLFGSKGYQITVQYPFWSPFRRWTRWSHKGSLEEGFCTHVDCKCPKSFCRRTVHTSLQYVFYILWARMLQCWFQICRHLIQIMPGFLSVTKFLEYGAGQLLTPSPRRVN